MDNKEVQPYNVYFIADSHIGHKNILHYQANRIGALNLKDENDIEGMNQYIYDMWDNTVNRGDHVYLLGDVFLVRAKVLGNACKGLRKKVQTYTLLLAIMTRICLISKTSFVA